MVEANYYPIETPIKDLIIEVSSMSVDTLEKERETLHKLLAENWLLIRKIHIVDTFINGDETLKKIMLVVEKCRSKLKELTKENQIEVINVNELTESQRKDLLLEYEGMGFYASHSKLAYDKYSLFMFYLYLE